MGIDKMRDKTFDSGCFKVYVPDGWMAFCGIDSECKKTKKKVHVYKEAKLETDIFTHAGITICFFDSQDCYLSAEFVYDNVTDIETFTLGKYIWNGYTCTSLGYPYTMLEAEYNGCVFQVMILMKNGEHEISLEDADVKKILESLE